MKVILLVLAALLAASFAHGAIQVEDVDYDVGGSKFSGHIYYDDAADGKRPGVLVVHEWWGLNDHAKERARMLAQAGYVAFALDMYGEGKTTEHPEEAGTWSNEVTDEVGVARFSAAQELLSRHERVDPDRIGAIGYCFGGGVVLRAAKAGAMLRGVVSFHGSLPTKSVEPGSVRASILVCHGAADPFASFEQIEKFQNVLSEAGADWQFIAYGGAKHSFTAKSADQHGIPALEYNENADRRSWAAMLTFFAEVLEEN